MSLRFCVLACLLVASCGAPSDADGVDADVSGVQVVVTTSRLPDDSPLRIAIEGQETSEFSTVVDKSVYEDAAFDVEAVYASTGTVVDRAVVVTRCQQNLEIDFELLAAEQVFVSVTLDGHLIQGSGSCDEAGGGGGSNEHITFDCQANPLDAESQCEQGRCGLRRAHDEPAIMHVACTSQGSAELGAACSFAQPTGAESFDNCVAGTGCVGGVCEELCYLSGFNTCTSGTCLPITGLNESDLGYCGT